MPYQVTSSQGEYTYTAIVPRRLLAHTIIKFLAKQGLNLQDFQQIIHESHLNPLMIIDENQFKEMLLASPGLDLIYDSILLKDNTRIYYHTNWTVPKNNWQLMSSELNRYDMDITTIQTPDSASSIKTKALTKAKSKS